VEVGDKWEAAGKTGVVGNSEVDDTKVGGTTVVDN